MQKKSANLNQWNRKERYFSVSNNWLGLQRLIPKIGGFRLGWHGALRHLRLIPYDILVILFIGNVMLPVWAAALLVAVNVGTWWCYYRIPQFLRTVSGRDGEGILIPGPIVEDFARFINSCGVHHRAHYGLMFAMMGGFHAAMTGGLWSLSIPAVYTTTLAWLSYAALLLVDFTMYWVSLRTLQELREDKLAEANEYTDELKRSNEELEQFAYIASHDLRTPLRGIINLSKWIDEDVRDKCSDETRHNLDLLHTRTQRMDNLLHDLLQYSRIGREETETEQISLSGLTSEVFDSLNIERNFTLHQTGHDILVNDYRVTFEMLLSNLIGNAIKHSDKQVGNVWISFLTSPTHLTIIVDDDGPGIEEKYRTKIFDVFSTLDRRDQKEASGMGLAIVKKIVHHKSGSVTVDASEHGGAQFTIELPFQRHGLQHG